MHLAASGFEHSIANMGIFSIALMLPRDADLTLLAAVKNVLIVTFGNMVGGSLLLAVPYWYASKSKEVVKVLDYNNMREVQNEESMGRNKTYGL